jgi:hypothetical protein
MKVGRNEACPCNSGRKFKQCCEKTGTKTHRIWNVALLVLVVLLAAGAGLAMYSASTSERTDPPGKVWSEEHGHWHDTPVGTPQPIGTPPPGKVWSEEHSHWHDAATGTATADPADIDVSTTDSSTDTGN